MKQTRMIGLVATGILVVARPWDVFATTPSDGPRLTYGETEMPHGINGLTPGNPAASRISEFLHASPMRANLNLQVSPMRASMDHLSADGKIRCRFNEILINDVRDSRGKPWWISFTIDPMSRWSDGNQITVDDFDTTLKLLGHRNTRPLAFPFHTFISHGDARVAQRFGQNYVAKPDVGDKKYTVHLRKNPMCIRQALMFKLLPAAEIDNAYINAEHEYPTQNSAVSGPYKPDPEKWRTKDELRLARNTCYRSKKRCNGHTEGPPDQQRVEKITMRYYIRRDLMMKEFAEGVGRRLQLIPEITPLEFQDLRQKLSTDKIGAEPYFSNRAHAFVFNVRNGRRLTDRRLRRYVEEAFDKEYAFNELYGAAREGISMSGPFLPKTVEDPDIESRSSGGLDLKSKRQRMRGRLAELLRTDESQKGHLLKLRLIYRETQDERLQDLIRQFVEELSQAGIRLISPKPIAHHDWHRKLYTEHDFDIALIEHVAAHPVSVLAMFSQSEEDLKPGGRNIFGYRNPKLGRLIDEILGGGSDHADFSRYRQIHQKIHESILGIWLWQERALAIYRPDVVKADSLHIRDGVFFGQPAGIQMHLGKAKR